MPEQAARWLSYEDAAHRIGKSVVTVKRYIRDERLPTLLGRVKESDIVAAEERARARMKAGKRPKGERQKDWLEVLADTYSEVAGLDAEAVRGLRDFARWAATRAK